MSSIAPHAYVKFSGTNFCANRDCNQPEFAAIHRFDPWAHAEHYTDEPRHEIEYGINVGDPAECCDPVLITDDPGAASENAQIVRDPFTMRRTVTTMFGPWELVDLAEGCCPSCGGTNDCFAACDAEIREIP